MPTGARLHCVSQQFPLVFKLLSLPLPEDRHTTAGSTKHRGERSEADRDTLLLQLQQNSLFSRLFSSWSQTLLVSVPEMKQVHLPDRYRMSCLRTKPQICICFLPKGQLSAAFL